MQTSHEPPKPTPPVSSAPPMGRAVSRGIFWALFVTGFGKFASLGSQVVLGWLLTQRDFGVFAAAMSFAAFVSVLRDGGCAKLLIQRGSEYEQLARPICYVSWMFNGLGAGLILVASPFAARAFGDPQVTHLLWIIALSLALGTPAMIGRSKMIYEMRFRELAKISSLGVLIRHGGMVLLAVSGLGPLSFVIPIVGVSLYEWYAFRRAVGPLPRRDVSNPFTRSIALSILGDTKWIILGALATTLITQGDYLVLGLMTNPVLLGTYFFGYQLTASISTLFTSGIQQAIMPGFTRLKNERQRLAQAYLRALDILLIVTTPTFILAALLLPVAIEFIWKGKWADAAPVAQLMAIALIARMAAPIGRAMFESLGKWRLFAIITGIDGALLIACLAITISISKDLVHIALAVASYRFASALFLVMLAAIQLDVSVREVSRPLIIILWGLALGFTAYLTSYYLLQATDESRYTQICLVASGLFSILLIINGTTIHRRRYIMAFHYLFTSKKREQTL